MKLTSIDLYSNGNQVAAFSFRDPTSSNPYNVQQITGLDSDEIVPKFYSMSADATTRYYNLVPNKKEVVLLISLRPKWALGKSYSDLRDDLYRAIQSSRDGTIHLQFKNGSYTVAAIKGFVVKFETNLNSSTPQVQLTIQCDDGLLRSLEEYVYDFNELANDMTLVDHASTAPHGFRFNVTFTEGATEFKIQDLVVPTWEFKVTPDTPFLVDDKLFFSSDHLGNEIYILKPDNKIKYLTADVALGSIWPIMFPGVNDMVFFSDGDFTWNELSFYRTYWGV